MKSQFMRPLLLLAVTLALAGCGGTASYEISGSVSNLLYPGLVVANGSNTVNVEANATKYALPAKVDYGNVYTLTIAAQPQHELCAFFDVNTQAPVATISNTAGRLAVISAPVVCSLVPHNVIVTVNEVAEGLVLANGSAAPKTFDATMTTATFSVAYGTSYGITVLTQPKNGKTCKVNNGTGVMGDDDITTTVTVTCA